MQLSGPKTARHHLRQVLAAVGTITLGVIGFATGADAASPTPITDYTGYPAALPAGCPDGTGSLIGLQFSNGRGGLASSLWALDVRHGDIVTMSWDDFATACRNGSGDPAIAVTLAAYDNPEARFDPSVDQHLVDGWESCGVGAGPCVRSGGRYRLQVTMPDPAVCNVQLDAALGLPLAVVGPNGSFYSSGARGTGPNRLLSAAAFNLNPCPPTPTTSTTTTSVSVAPTSTTVAGVVVEATTTTTPSTSVPGETPPSTTPTTLGAAGNVQPAATTMPAGTTAAGPAPAARQLAAPAGGGLPFTGADTLAALRIAALLGVTGAMVLAATAMVQRRRRAA